MIHVDVEQGSLEWLEARLGVPTASQFHRIVTPKTLKASSQAVGYRNELLAEWLLGESGDEHKSQFMARGSDIEDEARRWYEFDRGVTVERAGFCLTDDRKIGCSPDGLVGEDGGVEIKILAAYKHVGALLATDDAEHRCQIQGCLYVTGRRWWDRVYYHPTLPSVVHRMHRDEEFIGRLASELVSFLVDVANCRDVLLGMGCEQKQPTPVGTYCTARHDDGRYCMSRVDLADTPDGWRCERHQTIREVVEEAWKQYA
jgi:hypothetical protein